MNDVLPLIPQYFCSVKDIFNFLTINKQLYEKYKHSIFISHYQNIKNVRFILINYNKIMDLIPKFDIINNIKDYWNISHYTYHTIFKFMDSIKRENKLSMRTYRYIGTMKQCLKYKFGWKLQMKENLDAKYKHHMFLTYYNKKKLKIDG